MRRIDPNIQNGTVTVASTQGPITADVDINAQGSISGPSAVGLDLSVANFAGSAASVTLSSTGGGTIRLANVSVTPGSGNTSNTVVSTGATSGMVVADAGASITTGALDVISGVINLSTATINVGTGTAQNGTDPVLIAGANSPGSLIPATSPISLPSAPNASFISQSGVQLGDLAVEGSYLFVRAPNVTATGISGNDAPLDAFNFRTFSNTDTIQLTDINGALRSNILTYLLGGSGFAGIIDGAFPQI